MIDPTVGFVGAGLMAEALADALLRVGVARAHDTCASDPSEERRELFATKFGVQTFADNVEMLKHVQVVVLSVKPQVLPAVADEIAEAVTHSHLVISIVPGVTIAWLSEKLGTRRVVRVMPNTPAMVGAGASAYCRATGVSDADARLVQEVLSAVGSSCEVPERLMDAVTGLSGSGPAYVCVIIEALADGGVKMGLPRDVALQLAAQTVCGAAQMVLKSGRHPGELKDMVTTPGGTTIEGVRALERAGVRSALMEAVVAAAEKSRRLGEDATKK